MQNIAEGLETTTMYLISFLLISPLGPFLFTMAHIYIYLVARGWPIYEAQKKRKKSPKSTNQSGPDLRRLGCHASDLRTVPWSL